MSGQQRTTVTTNKSVRPTRHPLLVPIANTIANMEHVSCPSVPVEIVAIQPQESTKHPIMFVKPAQNTAVAGPDAEVTPKAVPSQFIVAVRANLVTEQQPQAAGALSSNVVKTKYAVLMLIRPNAPTVHTDATTALVLFPNVHLETAVI